MRIRLFRQKLDLTSKAFGFKSKFHVNSAVLLGYRAGALEVVLQTMDVRPQIGNDLLQGRIMTDQSLALSLA
jgi:hypothetical protein